MGGGSSRFGCSIGSYSYLILQSLAVMVAILLVATVLIVVVRRSIGRVVTESRRAGTLETIATLAIEACALVGILFVLLGVPAQAPTILGLTGAGLTVVFQDFILGFFGWFVLMGRNGIRVCDWVEISGVGGEVRRNRTVSHDAARDRQLDEPRASDGTPG